MDSDNYKNIAYGYYPKHVDCIKEKEKYLLSNEYQKLSSEIKEHLDNPLNKNLEKFLLRYKKMRKGMIFYDATLFNWQDRCYTFELNENLGNHTYSIRFYKSILVPYFIVRYFKIDTQDNRRKYYEIPLEETTKDINNTISEIGKVAKDILSIDEFGDVFINEVIEDINFEDIKLGNFTFFNAFFLNTII